MIMCEAKFEHAKTTLYLGIDPVPGVVHYPVIRTIPIDSEEFKEALRLEPSFTHVIFTSKNAIRFWPGSFEQKIVLAIGEATACLARERGAHCLVAPISTQEGLLLMMDSLNFINGCVLYPKSKLARPLLSSYLIRRRIAHYAFDLYDTIPHRPQGVLPDLDRFKQVVFTSPSTVRSFFQIFSFVPGKIELIPIGPITKKALFDRVSF